MTCAPRSDAEIFAMEPPNLPTAVRTAAVMTTSFIQPPKYQVSMPADRVHCSGWQSLLQYVFSGCIGERHVPGRGGSHRRRNYLLLRGVLGQPLFPSRPPGAGSGRRTVEPRLRRERLRRIQPCTEAVAPSRMHGAADDAGIVAAGSEQKSIVGRARQSARLVDRLPWGDVVGFRSDHEHRYLDAREIGAAAVGLKFAACQSVVEVQLA